MKKYFFNGLFILAVLVSASSILTSCKDNLGDEMAKLESNDNKLQDKIDQLTQITEDLAAAQEACRTACAEARAELENALKQYADTQDEALRTELEIKISELVREIATLKSDITSLTNQINTNNDVLNLKIENIQKLIDQLAAQNLELVQKINDDLAALEKKLRAEYTGLINSLGQDVKSLESIIDGLKPDIAKGVQAYEWMLTAKEDINSMKEEIDALEDALEALDCSSAESLNARIDSLADVTSDLEKKYNSLDEKLVDAIEKYDESFEVVSRDIDNLEGRADELEKDLEDLTRRVAANETAIAILRSDLDELTGRVDAIKNRLNKLITSILIQNVYNPVFGSYNLPLGVNTNILFGQYGEATQNIKFPSYATSAISEYNNAAHFTAKDFEMLGTDLGTIDLYTGDILSDLDDYSNVNLGTVYTTINPTDVNFEGTTFTLVNSQDEEAGVTLTTPVKSDKVLAFGSTRAADNGFYEMTATVAKEDLEDLKLPVTVTNELKQAVKDAYNNRSINDFAVLATQIAKTIVESQKLEAYGLKAAWNYEDAEGNTKTAATYSKYEMAATVYEPLSYSFMYGQSAGTLPTISPLSGFEFDKSKFTFNIDAPSFSFDGVDFNFNLTAVNITGANQIEVKIENFPVVDASNMVTGTETKIIVVDITNNIVAIENAFNDQITTWNADMKKAFSDAMKGLENDINKQLDDYLSQEIGKVNDKIGDLVDNINNKAESFINKANDIINKVNAVVEKINNLLTDPNHYLQVMMVYEGADGNLRHMSTTKATPTVFVVDGGNAITLYPTSYTGGILVPSYKKFVGVTNVYDADGNAQAGDADCISALNTANGNEYMATVIDGNTLEVPMQVKAGYTYEIAYSSLDYHGVTSTQKYYIQVK